MAIERSLFTKMMDSLNTGERGSYGYFTSDIGLSLANQAKQLNNLENIKTGQQTTNKNLNNIISSIYSLGSYQKSFAKHFSNASNHFTEAMYNFTQDIIVNQAELTEKLIDNQEKISKENIAHREYTAKINIKHREAVTENLIHAHVRLTEYLNNVIIETTNSLKETIENVAISDLSTALKKLLDGLPLSIAESNIIQPIFSERASFFVNNINESEALYLICHLKHNETDKHSESIKKDAFTNILEKGKSKHLILLLSEIKNNTEKENIFKALYHIGLGNKKNDENSFDARALLYSYKKIENVNDKHLVQQEIKWRNTQFYTINYCQNTLNELIPRLELTREKLINRIDSCLSNEKSTINKYLESIYKLYQPNDNHPKCEDLSNIEKYKKRHNHLLSILKKISKAKSRLNPICQNFEKYVLQINIKVESIFNEIDNDIKTIAQNESVFLKGEIHEILIDEIEKLLNEVKKKRDQININYLKKETEHSLFNIIESLNEKISNERKRLSGYEKKVNNEINNLQRINFIIDKEKSENYATNINKDEVYYLFWGKDRGPCFTSNLTDFKILNDYYTVDDQSAFYNGEKIHKADRKTFNLCEHQSYAKDKNFVFRFDEMILDVDTSTFRVINYQYALDKQNVFYELKKFSDESDSFELISKSEYDWVNKLLLAKDKYYIYFEDCVISSPKCQFFPDSKSIIFMRNMFARDKKHLFFLTDVRVLFGNHPSGRKIVCFPYVKYDINTFRKISDFKKFSIYADKDCLYTLVNTNAMLSEEKGKILFYKLKDGHRLNNLGNDYFSIKNTLYYYHSDDKHLYKIGTYRKSFTTKFDIEKLKHKYKLTSYQEDWSDVIAIDNKKLYCGWAIIGKRRLFS